MDSGSNLRAKAFFFCWKTVQKEKEEEDESKPS